MKAGCKSCSRHGQIDYVQQSVLQRLGSVILGFTAALSSLVGRAINVPLKKNGFLVFLGIKIEYGSYVDDGMLDEML